MKPGPVSLRPHEHESRLEDLVSEPAIMLSHALPEVINDIFGGDGPFSMTSQQLTVKQGAVAKCVTRISPPGGGNWGLSSCSGRSLLSGVAYFGPLDNSISLLLRASPSANDRSSSMSAGTYQVSSTEALTRQGVCGAVYSTYRQLKIGKSEGDRQSGFGHPLLKESTSMLRGRSRL